MYRPNSRHALDARPALSFYDPREYARVCESVRKGMHDGIGIQIRLFDNDAIAQKVFEGSPSRQGRLASGGRAGADCRRRGTKTWSCAAPAHCTERAPGLRTRGTPTADFCPPPRLQGTHPRIAVRDQYDADPSGGVPDRSQNTCSFATSVRWTDCHLRRALEVHRRRARACASDLDIRITWGGPLDQAIKVVNEFTPCAGTLSTRAAMANSY